MRSLCWPRRGAPCCCGGCGGWSSVGTRGRGHPAAAAARCWIEPAVLAAGPPRPRQLHSNWSAHCQLHQRWPLCCRRCCQSERTGCQPSWRGSCGAHWSVACSGCRRSSRWLLPHGSGCSRLHDPWAGQPASGERCVAAEASPPARQKLYCHEASRRLGRLHRRHQRHHFHRHRNRQLRRRVPQRAALSAAEHRRQQLAAPRGRCS